MCFGVKPANMLVVTGSDGWNDQSMVVEKFHPYTDVLTIENFDLLTRRKDFYVRKLPAVTLFLL